MGEPVEIKLRWKYRRPQANGRHKSPQSGHSGTNKHRGESNPTLKKAAQAATVANVPTLVLTGTGKRTWVRPPRGA